MAERKLLRLSIDRRATRGTKPRPGVENHPALVTVNRPRGWRHGGIGFQYKNVIGFVGVSRRNKDD